MKFKASNVVATIAVIADNRSKRGERANDTVGNDQLIVQHADD
jgi:hypothetical protein